MKPKDITDHPLLDPDQQRMLRIMMRKSASKGEPFELIDFAKVALRATGRDYAETNVDDEDNIARAVVADRALRHAAILYVYEALKACDVEIVKQWDGFDEMLQSLVYLAHHGDLP